jgi:hypothetical protein
VQLSKLPMCDTRERERGIERGKTTQSLKKDVKQEKLIDKITCVVKLFVVDDLFVSLLLLYLFFAESKHYDSERCESVNANA